MKLIRAIVLTTGFLGLLVGFNGAAQGQAVVEAYRRYFSAAAETCALIPIPAGQGAAFLYGIHVTNTAASTVYVQVFNATAQPAGATVPLGASSWSVGANVERDIDIGFMALSFNVGLAVCTSSTQSTFTASGATSGFIVTFR